MFLPFNLVFLMFLHRLQPPTVPNVSVLSEVVVDAFALAIVGYAISISLGKTFALKHGYKVDSNQVSKSPMDINKRIITCISGLSLSLPLVGTGGFGSQ